MLMLLIFWLDFSFQDDPSLSRNLISRQQEEED